MELKKRNQFDRNKLKRLKLEKRKRKSKALASKNAAESKESANIFEFINDTLLYKSIY
jgi:hypothetical protein